jgi:hypothetical protein
MDRDGHEIVLTPCGPTPVEGQTLGLHGTQWTLQSIYERYSTLERARRSRPSRRQWFAHYGPEFLHRFLENPTDQNFFSVMGVLAGVIASQNGEAEAKDYRTYDDLPGFEALRQFLAEIRADPLHSGRRSSKPTVPSLADRRKKLRR